MHGHNSQYVTKAQLNDADYAALSKIGGEEQFRMAMYAPKIPYNDILLRQHNYFLDTQKPERNQTIHFLNLLASHLSSPENYRLAMDVCRITRVPPLLFVRNLAKKLGISPHLVNANPQNTITPRSRF